MSIWHSNNTYFFVLAVVDLMNSGTFLNASGDTVYHIDIQRLIESLRCLCITLTDHIKNQ